MLVLVCLLRILGGAERLCFVGILVGHGRRDHHFFVFPVPNLVVVGIFSGIRAFLHVSGVGCGRGHSKGFEISGPSFSFSSCQLWFRCRFSTGSGHFFMLVGWGVGVAIPKVLRSRDRNFRFSRTEFSLGANFRYDLVASSIATVARCQLGL